jgi:4-hydroxy-tetrahydrodipicolinate synthase
MALFKGSGVAIITPFNENGVDFPKLGELLEWHVEQGTDAIIICGTTGEASTMGDEEKKAAYKYTVDKIAGRIPVIAGQEATAPIIPLSSHNMQKVSAAVVYCVLHPITTKQRKKALLPIILLLLTQSTYRSSYITYPAEQA